MDKYKNPLIISKSCALMNAAGQYIFEFTPEACPGLTIAATNYAGQEGGFELCFQGPPSLPGNYTAEITCQNIEDTFTVDVGSAVSLGNDCFFLPITSISPELPADCIVDSFAIDGGSDQCHLTLT